MLATKIEDAKREEGFTLIELLVVVLIIGILAAIAIPAFLNQRARAWESELTSGVRNVALEIEAAAVQEGGAYDKITFAPDFDGFVERVIGDPDPVVFVAPTRDAAWFCLQATHGQLTAPDNVIAYRSDVGGLGDVGQDCTVLAPTVAVD